MAKRVLLVDDNQLVRRALRELFSSNGLFNGLFVVAGEATNGQEAIQLAEQLRPDLIILDVSMPVMTGIRAAPVLLNLLPKTCIILFRFMRTMKLNGTRAVLASIAVVAKTQGLDASIRAASALYGEQADSATTT
jgi:two-component system chemotaxis response regulator CheY